MNVWTRRFLGLAKEVSEWSKDEALLRQAMGALERHQEYTSPIQETQMVIEVLKERLG